MRLPLPLAALVALLTTAPAGAQSLPKKVFNDAKAAGSDLIRIWDAPIHTDADDLPGIGAFIGGTLLIGAFDDNLEHWVEGHEHTAVVRAVHPFREGGKLLIYGSSNRTIPLSGILYGVGLVTGSDALRQAGLGCATTSFAGSTYRQFVYDAVWRPRPSAPDPDPYDIRLGGGEWDYHSFFSGHAANIVACATFWNERFDLGWYGVPLYVLAGGISLGRLADRRHWPSDVFVGVVSGYAMGHLIANRWKEREAKADSARSGRAADPSDPLRQALRGLYVGPMDGSVVVGWHASF